MKINNSTLWGTLLSVLVLAISGSYLLSKLPKPQTTSLESQSDILQLDNKGEQSAKLAVSIIEVKPGEYSPKIQGYGEVKARYELSLTAEVSARVVTVSTQLESGKLVKKGELLATLDQTKYKQALTEAKANLTSAQLDVLEEERQGEQAKIEWQRSGLSGEPDSPLVLREPQLEQVKAAYENAKQAVAEAQYDLNNTNIYAPFDALVVSRDIQLGSYLQEGSQIATLYSTDVAEVSIPLSETQWSNLPNLSDQKLEDSSKLLSATLMSNKSSWTGYVTRVEQHVDSASRQRSLIVSVDNPLDGVSPLYAGTFVTVSMDGQSIDNLWKLPQSALSQQGEIWFIDVSGKLDKATVVKHFEQDNYVYITPLSDISTQIIKRPLSSYSVGSKVEIIEEPSL